MPVDATRQVESATASISRPCLEKQVRAKSTRGELKTPPGVPLQHLQESKPKRSPLTLLIAALVRQSHTRPPFYFGLIRVSRELSRGISK